MEELYMTQPIVSWYEGINAKANEVTGTVNYGTVDADTDSNQKTFFIWNNRAGLTDVSKMEEVTFTTRDRLGGTGDTVGQIVEAVKDNWFQVRVDSLDEVGFTPVGKGGVTSTNVSGVKAVGTNDETKNINALAAVTWADSTVHGMSDYVKPTLDNQYIYKVTKGGTTGVSEPIWTATEGAIVTDGDIEYVAQSVSYAPASQEILGLANHTAEDGSNAADAGGNYIKITVYSEVPISAQAGRNLLLQRVSFRYV
jgi:hypothetical protein